MPPVTLTNSHLAAVQQSTAEPRVVIEFHSKHGTYYFAGERLKWSGIQYQPRLLNEPEIISGLGGVQGFGLTPTKTLQLNLANADGWLSTQPPDFYRYGSVIAREILLDVESFALRTLRYTATGGSMPANGLSYNIQCEDFWSIIRRRNFPSDSTLMTRQRFPSLTNRTNDHSNPRLNTPMNIVFGRCMAKATLIDEHLSGVESGALEWIIGYGRLTNPPGGRLYQYPDPISGGFVIFEASTYYLAHRTTYDGVPYTSVVVEPPGSPGDDLFDHYYDARGGVYGWPDEVLLFMMTNSQVGLGLDPTLIDSDSLLTARSWYMANNLTMDFAVTEQLPLESWLGEWSRDSMTRLILRDKMYLSPQMSRAPVGSLHVGNILKDSLSFSDALIGQEESRVSFAFRDRFRADDVGHTVVAYSVGSGATAPIDSRLVGRPTVAGKVAQTIAKRAADGIRTYTLGTTLRLAAVEEGDLLSLHHPLAVPSASPPRIVEVETIRRARGILSFSTRDIGSRMFVFGNLPADTSLAMDGLCPDLTQFILPFSWGAITSGTNDVIVISHGLGYLPSAVTHRWLNGSFDQLGTFAMDTLSFTYNTTSTVAARFHCRSPTVGLFGNTLGGVYDIGWLVTVPNVCPPDNPPD
jgi:hypothetical protein